MNPRNFYAFLTIFLNVVTIKQIYFIKILPFNYLEIIMKFSFKSRILVFIGLLFSFTSQATTAEWIPSEMLKLKTIKEIQFSPDNEKLVFVVNQSFIDENNNKFISRIYTVDAHAKTDPIALTSSEGSATQPQWSPDGNWIAFIFDSKNKKNLFLINSQGGEPIQLTDESTPVMSYLWSPDSKHIVLLRDNDQDKTNKKEPYIYKGENANHGLWIIDIDNNFPATSRQLTPNTLHVRSSHEREFDWSPDGNWIAFSHSKSHLVEDYYDCSISFVDPTSGNIIHWDKKNAFEALPRYSSDGQQIAYLTSDNTYLHSHTRQIAVRSVKGTDYRLLAPTFNQGYFLMGPSFLGWNHDDTHILLFEPKGTKFHIEAVPTNGEASHEIDLGEWIIREPALNHDKKQISFIASGSNTPPEVHVTELDDFHPQQLTQINKYFKTFPQTKTEVIHWQSTDGLEIEGLLTYPVNYQAGQHCPLLVIIHGGPMANFNESFLGNYGSYPVAAFVQKGFAVFRPNPRGSCGYGKDFRCANYGDWGGKDFDDIMTGVDTLIARGIVDSDKMGVMGWSYGGYMTAWAITQTNRFKAASMGAGVSDLISMTGTMDLVRFIEDCLFVHYTDNLPLYVERSAIFHVSNVKTPLLIQHGLDDSRVPVSQAYEFHHALKRAKKEAVLVLYPRTGHSFSEPKALLHCMEKNLSWFSEHLQP